MSMATIDPRQLQQRLERGEAVRLIDVRSAGEFASEHIEHAELTPLDELDPAAVAGRGEGPICVICRTGRRASDAAKRLVEAGAADVRVVEGGLEGWKQAGLAVERGRGVISLERQVRIGAGALVLVGVLLGWLVHPALLVIPAFVGGGLMFAGITDWCGMAMMLAKMPWNRRPGQATCKAGAEPGKGAACSS